MRMLFSGAAIALLSVGTFAQTPTQTPSPTQVQQPAPSSGVASSRPATQDQTVTVVGCVQREADYRKAQDAGRGGAVGTGIGVGNEFILANAMMSAAGATAGAAGAAAANMAFELTGPNEGQAEQFVGRRVEVAGKMKAAETNASGAPTGGPTAGAPPSGVDVTSRDLKLREIEVTTIRAAAAGTCPAA
jgi:hypothetical protein